MDVSLIGIALLTPAFLLPEPAQVSCKAGAYIHAPDEAQLSPIVLQTISDILVDCAAKESLILSSMSDNRRGIYDGRRVQQAFSSRR